ncbi:MAG: kinase [Euryarchaeota archaeon]|nr:kinase [Euryarchaeota archaeon]
MRAGAFVPGHITGFFEVFLTGDALTSGSRGAGVVLSEGVVTRVEVRRASEPSIEVELNGEACECEVSERVATALLRSCGSGYALKISHTTPLPVMQGFGTSAAGALGTAIALNEALGLRMSALELARIAHCAEVECRTGLGDVVAQLSGGLVVRTRAGAPGVGEVRKFYSSAGLVVFLVGRGLKTREVLSSPGVLERINRIARGCLEELLRAPCAERFMSLSKKFALKSGLARGKVREAIYELEEHGIEASMAMLGEAVFALSEKPDELVNLLDFPSIIARVDNCGARLL